MRELISASGFIVLLLVLELVLWMLPRARRFVGILLAVAIASFLLFTNGPLAGALLGSLEYEFRPVQDNVVPGEIDTIVVLTGYASVESNVPVTGYVNDASALRLMEAKRLLGSTRAARVVISGGGDFPETMKLVLQALDVSSPRVVLESQSKNTYESAINLRALVGERKFLLVTSAGHMPRTMRVFRKQGLNPIPAPTHYLTVENIWRASWVPSGLHLYMVDLAIHEYVGLLWYRMTGRI